jgi:hypothetical protein
MYRNAINNLLKVIEGNEFQPWQLICLVNSEIYVSVENNIPVFISSIDY